MISLFVSLSKCRGRWKVLLVGWIATAALGLWGMRLAPDGRSFPTTSTSSATCSGSASASSSATPTGSSRWRAGSAPWLQPRRCSRASPPSRAGAPTRGGLRRRRGHSVVLGLGDRGSRIATGAGRAGRDVVAVEVDPSIAGVAALRRRDGEVVEGDARHSPPARQAGLATAAEVVVVCGTDATNAEVVAAISALSARRGAGPLRAAVHLSDAGLCALMRHQSLRTAASGVRFDFFDVYSAGARLLLSDHPLDAVPARDPAHLVIVGVGQFGRCCSRPRRGESHDGSTTDHGHRPRRPGARAGDPAAQPGLAEEGAHRPDRHRPGAAWTRCRRSPARRARRWRDDGRRLLRRRRARRYDGRGRSRAD